MADRVRSTPIHPSRTLRMTVFGFFSLMAIAPAVPVTVDFPVVQDAWVSSARPTRNYGFQSSLRLRDGDRRIPYLQFEVSGVTGIITSASVHLRLRNDTGTIAAHPVADQSWAESDITFDTKPAWQASAGSAFCSTGGFSSIPLANGTITGNGLISFALRSANLNGEVDSRESANIPFLRVTYEETNLAPVAAPEAYNVISNTLRTVPAPGVLANDSDANGDALVAEIIIPPQHGTMDLRPDGSFTYLPDNGYTGADSFTYRALDTYPSGSLASAAVVVELQVIDGGQGGFTPEELARIQQDLGVELGVDDQLELAAIVKPTIVEPWRAEAQARIEQYRKADLEITVFDAGGSPLAGAPVSLRLRKKDFRFGGVLDLAEFSQGIPGGVDASRYRELALAYFDACGLDNGLKPKLSAGNATALARLRDEYFPWCAANELPSRGHLLIWPGGTHMSAAVTAKVEEIENTDGPPTQTQIDELRALVDAEISGWAAEWPVYEWDVLNEPLANHRIQDILGAAEPARWFQLAATHRVQPGAGLFINEYQIISGDNENRFPAYKAQIQALVDAGAPISGIGFQSRFKFKRENPATLYSRLEQFATYNKDLAGTEFEVIPNRAFQPDENLRARITEEVMTIYFSHPKVTALNAWAFAGTMPSALVRENGSPKLNGLVWYYVNRLRHDTRADLVTDAAGKISLRGYKGTYDVTVSLDGAPVAVEVYLDADKQVQIGTTLVTSATHTLAVTEDSFVQEGANAANNFGNNAEIHLRTPDGSNGRIGYLKFDLTGIPSPVLSARLRLYSTTETGTVEAFAVADSSWKEINPGGIHWNNRPHAGVLLGAAAPTAAGTEFEIPLDASSLVPDGQGRVSIALNETGFSFGKLASRNTNASNWPIPRLILTTGTPDTDGDGLLDPLDPDDDNDGLPDAWESAHGLDPLVAQGTGIDTDADGRADFLEFALATDAAAPDGGGLQIGDVPDGSLRLTYRHRLTPFAAVALAHATDLGEWTRTGGTLQLPPGHFILQARTSLSNDSFGPVEEVEIEFLPPSDQRAGFFRLEAWKP